MTRKCSKCEKELEVTLFEGEAEACKECEKPPETREASGLDKLTAVLETSLKRDDERFGQLQQQVTDAVGKLATSEPNTPSKKIEAGYHTNDEYDERGFSGTPNDPYGRDLSIEQRADNRRANFEVARMIMGGAGPRVGTSSIEPSERFMQCFHAAVTEADRKIWIADAKGKPVRAMDTAESGYGSQLIGAQYVRDIWEATRNLDSIVGDIRTIPMTDPTVYVPIDGDLPEMLFVGESTSSSASNYTTSKTASNRVTLTAKKFTIQQIWSGELEEDSIIAFTPFLRERLAISMAQHLGSCYYNGDDTDAGTGNINTDDANPTDTKHFLAWDGIRHYWLVDATGQGKDMAAVLDPKEVNVARGKLNAGDDDVDALLKNINWGLNSRDLRLVCDFDTYMALLDADKVTTVDKYGPSATIVTGELGSIYGIPIISPGYASKTEADGKASGTEASNTKGQITVYNPRGFLGGVRRDVQFFMDRIQRTDQLLIELYTRRAFTRFGGNVAAGIYDITL